MCCCSKLAIAEGIVDAVTGCKVEWVKTETGMDQVELLRDGQLDIACIGSHPNAPYCTAHTLCVLYVLYLRHFIHIWSHHPVLSEIVSLSKASVLLDS